MRLSALLAFLMTQIVRKNQEPAENCEYDCKSPKAPVVWGGIWIAKCSERKYDS